MCFVSKQIFQSTLRFNIKLLLIIIITVTNTVIAIVYMIICIIYMYHLFVSFICIIYLYHLYDHLYILFDESYVFHREIWFPFPSNDFFLYVLKQLIWKKRAKVLDKLIISYHYHCYYFTTYLDHVNIQVRIMHLCCSTQKED